jgi:hypothetical protein
MITKSIFDLTAIDIGINSKAWEYMYEGDPSDACKDFMVDRKYDILPLKNKTGMFNQFYVTSEWNHFDLIKQKHKSVLPKMKADTTFPELLDEFASHSERFFLLYKGASIVGLISVVNFSFREIYKRLYNLLAELEISLSNWLFNIMSDEDALNVLLSKSGSANSKSVVGQYLIDQRIGNDGPFKEYLYLSSLHSIIKEKGLFQTLGYTKKGWNDIADPLFETRNSIAHPIRSIIKERCDFKRVNVCLAAATKLLSAINKPLKQ